MTFLIGFLYFVAYYGITASALLVFRYFFEPPSEVFRKLLHGICVLSIFVLVYGFEQWYEAALTPILFAAMVYPAIWYLERFPHLMSVLIERKPGEIKHSLVLVFVMMALLIGLYWGLLGPDYQYIVIAAVLTWGFGDAAAALIGKAWGKTVIPFKWSDGKKTVEGFWAMTATAAMVLSMSLALWSSLPLASILWIAVVIAPVSAFIELISKGGIDTLSVPLLTSIGLMGMTFLLR